MRTRRGPAPKWRKHYGEHGTGFYEAGNQVQLIPTKRAVDFILKHHLRIGEMLMEGVLFKDIWRAARATQGFTVPYPTFYAVARRFADFLGVPRRKARKRLLDDQLRDLADRLRGKASGRPGKSVEIVVEPVPPAPPTHPTRQEPDTLTPAQRRRKELLGEGKSVAALHDEQLAAALRSKT